MCYTTIVLVRVCCQFALLVIPPSLLSSLPPSLSLPPFLPPSQFTVLDDRLQELMPALTEVLNSLLDPRLFSVDRGQLHILLHHSRSLSEFFSLVKDIEATLSEVLDQEEDMADMYLTHWNTAG